MVYVGLLLPTGVPLSSHWYTGVAPPWVGVAVKVTEFPPQIGLADGEILTETGEAGLIVMVTILDSAGFPVGQLALEVSLTLIWSPLANAALV